MAAANFGDPLTEAEITVLDALAVGLDTAEVARRTGVTKKSVDGYLYRAWAKLGAKSSPHAVALAFAQGWLTVRRSDGRRCWMVIDQAPDGVR